MSSPNAVQMSVVPLMKTGGNVSVQTNATGSNFNAFASQLCSQFTIVNDTGTAIEVQQDGTGVNLPIASGATFTFFGLSNANQLAVRRVDVSNTQVTVKARWES